MAFIPSNDQLDVVNIHSFLHPRYNSHPFREFECRNDRWRAIVDQVCEKRSRQFQVGRIVSPLEEYRGPTEEETRSADIAQPHFQLQKHLQQRKRASSELDEDDDDDDQDDAYHDSDAQDTKALIDRWLNNTRPPVIDSTINIGLLPVNNPTHNLVSVAAPNAITITPPFETASSASIPTSLSAPAVPLSPVLTAPFDTNPYTTTITVAEWQEFLSRPSTVQIWRRKAVLGETGGDSNGISETLSVHTSAKRRKKYEWTQVYVCAHAGAKRDRRDPNKRRRQTNKKSIKCGCKARITAGKVIDADSVVVRWSWEHYGHEYAYPVTQTLKDVATGDDEEPGNMQEIGNEVQSLLESIGNLRNMEAMANGNDGRKLLLWRDLLACTLSKGAEIFGS
ncbi:uncharacterized protein V1513DRAFT_437853 [Lipomyces chichibuensis]|uniref:uncharacterized protein n=1 Tax=Lipomyces chichibuensis TaxID=1546026 RepID=UPI003343880E